MENVPLTSGHFEAALDRMALEGAACAMARRPETEARIVEYMFSWCENLQGMTIGEQVIEAVRKGVR